MKDRMSLIQKHKTWNSFNTWIDALVKKNVPSSPTSDQIAEDIAKELRSGGKGLRIIIANRVGADFGLREIQTKGEEFIKAYIGKMVRSKARQKLPQTPKQQLQPPTQAASTNSTQSYNTGQLSNTHSVVKGRQSRGGAP